MSKYGIQANTTLFFALKNAFMIFEDLRMIRNILLEYKDKKLKINSENNCTIEIESI
jgi:hypothetical protein